jgi:glutamyl-tRNA synthetase
MSETKQIRVRMAPSPTGTLHVGGARTALFNWLYARHNGGMFMLRIEDTDQLRSKEEYFDNIIWAFKWLGLDWDEGPLVGGPYGPYFQMQRLDSYKQAVDKLLAEGKAYRCYCTPEELEEARAEARANKAPFRYRGRCKLLSPEQRAQYEAEGRRSVIRFATPESGPISYDDLIHGPISIDASELDDFVIVKSDGIPTYNLAVVIDDSSMEISHVLRADEHIANTPKQLLLYQALGIEPPRFGHMPLVLGMDRSKMSKRYGAASVTDFANLGYLPEALINFLALLGWSFDDKREIFSLEELVQHFSLDRLGKTGGAFNIEKLDWMNGYYIRQLTIDDLLNRSLPFLKKADLLPEGEVPAETLDYLKKIMPLVQERLKRLNELPELVSFFLEKTIEYDETTLIQKGMDREGTLKAITRANEELHKLGEFDVPVMEAALRGLADEMGLKPGQLFGTLRVAITGRSVAPPLFQTMAVLGSKVSFERIDQAIAKLSQVC